MIPSVDPPILSAVSVCLITILSVQSRFWCFNPISVCSIAYRDPICSISILSIDSFQSYIPWLTNSLCSPPQSLIRWLILMNNWKCVHDFKATRRLGLTAIVGNRDTPTKWVIISNSPTAIANHHLHHFNSYSWEIHDKKRFGHRILF